ncbi:MAG: methyltransferase domain-containing protein [Acidobacteria bacterium]|nr:methyltransferase domain-containing protein [Acidobacteriota bacterium]
MDKLSTHGTRFDIASIRGYYDRHTPAFVAYGQGGGVGAIHRAVWGPGVTTREGAFRYVDDRIADLMRSLLEQPGASRAAETPEPPRTDVRAHVVDLGCGVGASLCYLAEQFPVRGTGVTLSPIQARLGTERVAARGLSDRVRCMTGDYGDLPRDVACADLAYAIESFVHSPAPDRFFAECGRIVRPGGLLVICDDVRRATSDGAAAHAIDRFRRGWHVNALLHPDELRTLARAAGFEHESTVDLTSALELGRVRDRAIGLMGTVCDRLSIGGPRLDYLLGGAALQRCLSRGWIGYELSVFRRLA